MSKITRQSNDLLHSESWINDFTNNVKLAKTLTDDYANDVLEAVADDTFSSLDAAISDLKTRIGLTASESDEIKRTCIAMVKTVNSPVSKVSDNNIRLAGFLQELSLIPDVASLLKKLMSGQPLTAEEAKGIQVKVQKLNPSELKDQVLSALQAYIPSETPQANVEMGAEASVTASKSYKKEKEDEEEKEGKSEKYMKKKNEEPKEASYKNKINKAWFQGSTEVPKEDKSKVVSNDPEALGKTPASGEMKYDHKPMETTAPKGEDSRPWEQDWFEGAAKDTKKVLGPAGEELTLKKKLQRAREVIQNLKTSNKK